VSNVALVFWIFAVVLFLFGVVFIVLGMNSERAYWSQRDPSGDARTDATPVSAIIKRAGHFAAGEYRAPLRIAAIGALMCEVAIGFAAIALIATFAT
jgi:hypothetical protein